MARTPLKVHVEGKNDQWALINILMRHGVDYSTKPWPPTYPEFQAVVTDSDDPTTVDAGLEGLLTTISDEVEIQAGRTVGFVLDADESPSDRWRSVRERLAVADVVALNAPNVSVGQLGAIPEGGFIGVSQQFKTRVGVWMMPDNIHNGAIENFLESLVPSSEGNAPSSLYAFAEDCTANAKIQHDAQFRDVDHLKATLACWLAWQKSPGRPYGTAIRANYFDKDSAIAHRFVSWFKSLFQIQS